MSNQAHLASEAGGKALVTGGVGYVGARLVDFECDLSPVRKLTGLTPANSLEEGLRLTYERMKPWAAQCHWWKSEQE